jgi:hypothetical protein
MDIDFSRRSIEKGRNTFHLKDIAKTSKSTFKYVWYVPSQYIDTKRLCAFRSSGYVQNPGSIVYRAQIETKTKTGGTVRSPKARR